MESALLATLGLFLVVNLTAFFVMLLDKARSRREGAERISEGLLFFMAAAFGSFGVYAGMFAFRHKTRKWYFLVGVPLLMMQNVAVFYLAYRLFAS
jgi:uncharacterized membrane protein YsdA (DUF1294 family)